MPGLIFRLFTVHYFPVGFSRVARFDRTGAILVGNGERNLGNDNQEGAYPGCIVCVCVCVCGGGGGGGGGRCGKI